MVRQVDITELNVNPVPFDILVPDNQTSRVMILQCSGKIIATNEVGNEDRALAISKHKSFLQLAITHNASLVITPEYSCPWSVIETITKSQELMPPSGSLWVIGCESITPAVLDKFSNSSGQSVVWRYEQIKPNGKQIFLSPIVYLFRLQNQEGAPSLCAIVQFKTHDMGGTNFERDTLIKGTVRYVLRNPSDPNSIRLLTLICADSFGFRASDLEPYLPYLIIHIQLTFDAYHYDFCKYRSEIFLSGNNNNCEILCLNWARGFEINGRRCTDYGGSGYLMNPERCESDPRQDEAAININHSKGIYLKFSKKCRNAALLFNPEECILAFDATKVSQFSAPRTHISRSGPSVIAIYKWINAENLWRETVSVCDGITADFEVSGGPEGMTPTNREKLLVISNGKLDPESIKWHMPKEVGEEDKRVLRQRYWHKARNLESYYLDSLESPKGTLVKLHSAQSAEVGNALSLFSNLPKYLSEKDKLPEVLYDLKKESAVIDLDSSEIATNKIRHNLKRSSGGGLATVVDLGSTLPKDAEKKFSDIKLVLFPERLVVWYSYKGVLRYICDKERDITDFDEHPEDITRT